MIMIKWKEGSTILSCVQVCSQHIENGLACKDKWASIFEIFQKIVNYNFEMGNNKDYWLMFSQYKVMLHLLGLFNISSFMT